MATNSSLEKINIRRNLNPKRFKSGLRDFIICDKQGEMDSNQADQNKTTFVITARQSKTMSRQTLKTPRTRSRILNKN